MHDPSRDLPEKATDIGEVLLASLTPRPHAGRMSIATRLRALDDRVLRSRGAPARERWFRQHGWTVFALLGVVLVAFGAWAVSVDRPALAGIPMAAGCGYLAAAVYLFVKRPRDELPRR